MQKLIRGIHQFQQSVFADRRALFEQLAKGQAPDALFVTCSDSRINPNLLTQTEPGELFILRNAGNIVPTWGPDPGGEAATLEFGVTALAVKDIIICGHSQCGAMKGLLDPESLRSMPAVASFLRHAQATRRIIEENYADLDGDARLTATVEENVLVQLENLRTHPAVADALARGAVRLHGWVYRIETGVVFAYDAAEGQFLPLHDRGQPGGTAGRLI